MKVLAQVVGAGYAVLVGAIAINMVAMGVGLTTWYGFFDDPSVGVVNGVFLFAIYPAALGGFAVVGGAGGQWIWRRLSGREEG